jgi:putative ABC transport system ATP-binding protein
MDCPAENRIVQIRKLDFKYREGPFRLHIPQLDVKRGESVAVIGPSGSGKTTLLNLVAGILAPPPGCLRVMDRSLTDLDESARRAFRIQNIGLVFQEFELLAHLNVLDNILLPYRIHPELKRDRAVRRRAAELAGEMGVGDKRKRYVQRLSQGERQRVAVCRALLHQPALLLCDEPTGNLDPMNKAHVLDVLFGYVQRNQTTLLTVTHDHDILKRFDRVIDFKDFQQPDREGTHA